MIESFVHDDLTVFIVRETDFNHLDRCLNSISLSEHYIHAIVEHLLTIIVSGQTKS